MRKILFTLLALLPVSFALAHGTDVDASQKLFWMKFSAKNKYERTEISNLGVSIEATVEDNVMAIGNTADLKAAKKTGKLLMSFPLTKEMKVQDFPANDSNFHSYSELWQALQALVARSNGLIKFSSLGRSTEGRDMPLLTFSSDGNDMSRPAVFFLGGHHAREHVSVELPLNLATYLLDQYQAGDARIVNLLNTRTVYIAPLINPDGAEFDIARGRYELWRKNRRNNGGNVYGVDLNRNYGYGWGGGGASTSKSNETYRGPSAFSEPETQAVKAFVDGHENINILLSFHTFSKLILYPWGGTYDKITNQADLKAYETMAQRMATWNGYTPEQSSDLYIASGDTTDWAYGTHGIFSFTFELDPEQTSFMDPHDGFYPGQAQIDPIFRKNLEPCLYLMEYSDNPYRVNQHSGSRFGMNSTFIK